MYTILLVIHTILVLFLIASILVQRTDSDGLSGLSGGGGGNQFMTGRGAANFWTRSTAILAAAFMLTSLVLVVMSARMNNSSIVDDAPAVVEQTGEAAPAEAPKPDSEKTAPTAPRPE